VGGLINPTLSNIPGGLSHWRTPYSFQKIEEESVI
jgi:hypothetical protein